MPHVDAVELGVMPLGPAIGRFLSLDSVQGGAQSARFPRVDVEFDYVRSDAWRFSWHV